MPSTLLVSVLTSHPLIDDAASVSVGWVEHPPRRRRAARRIFERTFRPHLVFSWVPLRGKARQQRVWHMCAAATFEPVERRCTLAGKHPSEGALRRRGHGHEPSTWLGRPSLYFRDVSHFLLLANLS